MKKKILTVIIALILVALAVVTITVQNRKSADVKNDFQSELNTAESEIEALKAQLRLKEAESKPYKEIFVDMLRRVDYQDETVYVIGHKTTDSDTVASAIGMAYLLNQLGIKAEAKVTGEINLETKYALTKLSYSVPEILENAEGKQLWLVDHSTSTQMVNGAEKARIVGITDHHGIGSAETTELICVLSCPAGSTCSIVSELFEICDVKLPKDVASVLLAGVLSDTSNMKSNVTKLDETVFAKLKELSGITDTDGLFAGMLDAKLSYEGLNDKEIFYSDYKNYEHNGYKYGIGCIKVARPDQIPAMAERMLAVIKKEETTEADFLLYHVYDADYSLGYTGIVGKDEAFITQLMESTFGEIAQKSGEFYVFTPSLPRNKSIVPPIDKYLDTVEKISDSQ